jgi:hypothetical protein
MYKYEKGPSSLLTLRTLYYIPDSCYIIECFDDYSFAKFLNYHQICEISCNSRPSRALSAINITNIIHLTKA